MDIAKVMGLVLEVGSGNNPNPRSNILCDRYIYDNSQRAGKFDAVIDRPMVVADGYRLPFGDKAFDFVICSHTLEHISDPVRFLKEISRVGKAGYIEVPSILSERIFGWDFHLWHIRLKGRCLHLYKKTDGERYGGFFHRKIADSIGFRRFFEQHQSKFYVRLQWRGKISCKVSAKHISKAVLRKYDHKAGQLLSNYQNEYIGDIFFYLRWIKRRLVNKSKKLFRRLCWLVNSKIFTAKLRRQISASLICINCSKAKLILLSRKLVCQKCNAHYPFEGVIPIMLTSKQREKGY